jgi:hypothetical protein
MPHQTDPKDPNSWVYGHTVGDYPDVGKDLIDGKSMPINPSVVRPGEAENFVDTNNARGVSGSRPQDFDGYGALSPAILQAKGLINAFYPQLSKEEQEREGRIRLGMNMLTFFTQMGAEASKPGATALGAANIAGANTAQQYINQVEAKRARDDKRKGGVLGLATQLMSAGSKGVAEKAFKFTEPINIKGVNYQKDSVEYFSQQEFNKLPSEIKRLLVPYSDPVTKDPAIGENAFGENIYLTGNNKGSRVYNDKGNFINYDTNKKAPEIVNTIVETPEVVGGELPRKLNLKELDFYGKLSGAYNNNFNVKTYQDLKGNANKVISNYNLSYTSETPQIADLGMIFSFMKMLDPRSVVREGEQAQAKGTGGIYDTLVNTFNSIQGGNSLTDGQRTAFRNLAMKYYKEATDDIETFNTKELEKGSLYGFKDEILKTYLITPKKFDITGYMARLPKINFDDTKEKRLIQFEDYVRKNKLKPADIYYMRKAKNYIANPNREAFDSLLSDYINKMKDKS